MKAPLVCQCYKEGSAPVPYKNQNHEVKRINPDITNKNARNTLPNGMVSISSIPIPTQNRINPITLLLIITSPDFIHITLNYYNI